MGKKHQDINLEEEGRIAANRWPGAGHKADNTGHWLHSDYKNAALPFVFPLFELMIDQSKLP